MPLEFQKRALLVVFIGFKLLLMDIFPIPVLISLAVIMGILAATVVLSLYLPPTGEGSAYPFPGRRDAE